MRFTTIGPPQFAVHRPQAQRPVRLPGEQIVEIAANGLQSGREQGEQFLSRWGRGGGQDFLATGGKPGQAVELAKHVQCAVDPVQFLSGLQEVAGVAIAVEVAQGGAGPVQGAVDVGLDPAQRLAIEIFSSLHALASLSRP